MNNHIVGKEVEEQIFYKEKYETFKYFRKHCSVSVDVSSAGWQDINNLYNSHRSESDTEIIITSLLHYAIIKTNYNRTKFRIIEHTYQDVIKHANKLIDVIGYDKYQEILSYTETELWHYINNSNLHIKNAILMDMQLWISNNE